MEKQPDAEVPGDRAWRGCQVHQQFLYKAAVDDLKRWDIALLHNTGNLLQSRQAFIILKRTTFKPLTDYDNQNTYVANVKGRSNYIWEKNFFDFPWRLRQVHSISLKCCVYSTQWSILWSTFNFHKQMEFSDLSEGVWFYTAFSTIPAMSRQGNPEVGYTYCTQATI